MQGIVLLSTSIPILEEHDLLGGRIEPQPAFKVRTPPQLVLIHRVQEGVSRQQVIRLVELSHKIRSFGLRC